MTRSGKPKQSSGNSSIKLERAERNRKLERERETGKPKQSSITLERALGRRRRREVHSKVLKRHARLAVA